jgi:polyisoprenoid-binding protein YceI
MKTLIRIASYVVLLSLISCATSLFAQARSFELDSSKTTVTFTLDATLHSVHGSFKVQGGSIRFDPQSGAASGKIAVDATSAETGNDGRDNKMHKEVLESAKYHEISFSPTGIVGTVSPGSTVQLQGIFHIHGADHPLTLSVPLEIEGDQLTAKLHFNVPYVEWGMKNPSTFVLRVSKEVAIDIMATGHLSAAP